MNGLSIEQAIHEEVIALIKSTPKVTLKVRSVGALPVKERHQDTLSWRRIDGSSGECDDASNRASLNCLINLHNLIVAPVKPCPVHAGSDGSWSGSSSSGGSRR